MSWLFFHLGCLLGWATHPLLWPVYSPWRWLFYMGITATQESGGNAGAVGDDGASLGMLQFFQPTRAALGMTDEQAKSPLWSGYYGAVYVSQALLSDWSWWYSLSLPVYGAGALRVLWRSGIGAASSWRDGMSSEYAGAAYWPAYARWVMVPFLFTVMFGYGLVYKADRLKVLA